MNAIKFIQHNGVDKAREVVEGAPDWAMSINFNNGMYYSRMEHKKGDTFLYDIKRLVESVELINGLKGIDIAKKLLARINKHGSQYAELFERPALEQAIADYELLFCSGESK